MPICFSFQTNLNLFKMNLDRGATYLFPCCNQHQSCFFFKNLYPVYYWYISGINIHIHIYFRTFSLDHIFMFITQRQTNLTTHIKFLFFQCLPCSTSATGFITLSSCQACTPPTGGRSELFFMINITFAQ